MKNRIAFLIKPKKFEIEFENIKKLAKDYVLVKIFKTGVCGSDLHYFRHGGLGSFKSKMPLSMGHEASGVIVDSNNTKLKNYSKVIIDPLNLADCGDLKDINMHICIKCLNKVNLCPTSRYLGSGSQEGTFREFIPLHISQLTVCNDNKAFEYAQIFEPLGIAMYSVSQSRIDYAKKNKIMILGSGTIGLLIAEVLKARNVKNVTVVDELDYRLQFAKKKLKTKITLAKDKNYFLDNKNSFDIIFDTVTNNWTFDVIPRLLNSTGKMVIVGIPSIDLIPINPHLIRLKEIEIINVRRSNIKMHNVLEFYYDKGLNLKKYETHKFELNDIQKAFELSSGYLDQVIRCSVFS